MEAAVKDENQQQQPHKTFAEVFDEAFPQYLAMGMTRREFWEEDSTLVIAYRKAYKIKQERENQYAWLQGLYIYKALNSALLTVNGFVPKGAKIDPYWDKPYDFEAERKKTKEETNQQKMQDASTYMTNLAVRFNRMFANKKKPEPEQKTEPEQE